MAARVAISSGPSRLAVPPWVPHGEACAYFGAADGSIGLTTYDGLVPTRRLVYLPSK